jgi:hypothetical protein
MLCGKESVPLAIVTVCLTIAMIMIYRELSSLRSSVGTLKHHLQVIQEEFPMAAAPPPPSGDLTMMMTEQGTTEDEGPAPPAPAPAPPPRDAKESIKNVRVKA